jgi:hypothetical protein
MVCNTGAVSGNDQEKEKAKNNRNISRAPESFLKLNNNQGDYM